LKTTEKFIYTSQILSFSGLLKLEKKTFKGLSAKIDCLSLNILKNYVFFFTKLQIHQDTLAHITVVCAVPLPFSGSEGKVNLVLLQTFLLSSENDVNQKRLSKRTAR